MKKILSSLSIIAFAAIVAISATSAYFSDEETSAGNSFASGTMDLDIDGNDVAVHTMNLSDIAPGDSGSDSATIKNSGSLSGELDIATGAVVNYPCTDGANGGKNDLTEFCDGINGALGANTEMALYIDVDESGTWTIGDIGLKSNETIYTTGDLVYDSMDNYTSKTWSDVYTGLMAVGAQDEFVIDWEVPTDTGNDIQGDVLKFDITFTLEQADKD